jgi:hypothetical protein
MLCRTQTAWRRLLRGRALLPGNEIFDVRTEGNLQPSNWFVEGLVSLRGREACSGKQRKEGGGLHQPSQLAAWYTEGHDPRGAARTTACLLNGTHRADCVTHSTRRPMTQRTCAEDKERKNFVSCWTFRIKPKTKWDVLDMPVKGRGHTKPALACFTFTFSGWKEKWRRSVLVGDTAKRFPWSVFAFHHKHEETRKVLCPSQKHAVLTRPQKWSQCDTSRNANELIGTYFKEQYNQCSLFLLWPQKFVSSVHGLTVTKKSTRPKPL